MGTKSCIWSKDPQCEGHSQTYILGKAEFKAQGGLIARVKGLDIQAYLTVESFSIVRVRKDQASNPVINQGPKFGGAAEALIHSAFSGDFFLFSKVSVLGPGFRSPVLDNGGRVDIE